MEQNFKIAVPEGCKAEIKQDNGFLVVTFEPKEWKPKDGDIIAFSSRALGIFKDYGCLGHTDYVVLSEGMLRFNEGNWKKDNLRPATEEEKQLLFDALAKEGKRWNAEEKRIEDLPRWRALYNENYYLIGSELTVDCQSEIGYVVDDNRYNAGNYFKTREAAERAAEKIRKILKESKAE